MNRQEIEQSFISAGWDLDGGFLDHLLIGNDGDLAVLAHEWAWQNNTPTYELYDAKRHVSCWVREVPTPRQAREILEEHGGTPEEEPSEPPRAGR
ncbi:MAG: hypothetical protein JOZ19_07155 [Rubrobacter sp.]|nr:hypothetical protein [Rubrobacter sp.]